MNRLLIYPKWRFASAPQRGVLVNNMVKFNRDNL